MIDYIIAPSDGRKGRVFSAKCAAFITANPIFPEAGGTAIRPIWAMFLTTEQELRPFVANLRLGRIAERTDRDAKPENRMEFLKSARYRHEFHREAEGAVASLWYPSLFSVASDVSENGVSFAMLVPDDWASAQDVDAEGAVAHVRSVPDLLRGELLEASDDWFAALLPTAYLFAAYLDARTRCPLVNDGRFFLQLLLASFVEGFAAMPIPWDRYVRSTQGVLGNKTWFMAYGLRDAGVRHAVAARGNHEAVDELIAEQTAAYFRAVR